MCIYIYIDLLYLYIYMYVCIYIIYIYVSFDIVLICCSCLISLIVWLCGGSVGVLSHDHFCRKSGQGSASENACKTPFLFQQRLML